MPTATATSNATLIKDEVSAPSSISTPRTVRTHGERGLDIPLEMAQLLRAELRRVYPELADLPFKSTRMCWYALYSTLVDHAPARLSARPDHLRILIPAINYRFHRYADTRDEDWIIDEHPDHPNLYFATGGSGHAFKVGSI